MYFESPPERLANVVRATAGAKAPATITQLAILDTPSLMVPSSAAATATDGVPGSAPTISDSNDPAAVVESAAAGRQAMPSSPLKSESSTAPARSRVRRGGAIGAVAAAGEGPSTADVSPPRAALAVSKGSRGKQAVVPVAAVDSNGSSRLFSTSIRGTSDAVAVPNASQSFSIIMPSFNADASSGHVPKALPAIVLPPCFVHRATPHAHAVATSSSATTQKRRSAAAPVVTAPELLVRRYELKRDSILSADGYDQYVWSQVTDVPSRASVEGDSTTSRKPAPSYAPMSLRVPMPEAPPAALLAVSLVTEARAAASEAAAHKLTTIPTTADALIVTFNVSALKSLGDDGAQPVMSVPLHRNLDWSELLWGDNGVTVRGIFYRLSSFRAQLNCSPSGVHAGTPADAAAAMPAPLQRWGTGLPAARQGSTAASNVVAAFRRAGTAGPRHVDTAVLLSRKGPFLSRGVYPPFASEANA